ncbi:MAG: acetyl-CoA carboxylase biotin carboxylase subunit [Bacteroidales bacterium]
MINKILIANRGEIALRIMRTCREIGIKTVAVFSEADRASLHVRFADEAYCIGSAASSDSYLRKEKIIETAKIARADAIHPGYGFLSENSSFSALCEKEGIIFIGPSAHAILTMGDKITARKTMIAAGVPVVPGGTEKINSEDEALKLIREIGLPVMIKASAGGGGKGMRLVKNESEIVTSVRSARSEAMSAFGDDSVYIEKYIDSPHHIEFQILADNFGNTVHLFERECSVQRRHQKVVEETPSPIMTDEVRNKMGECAVAAAKAVNYSGAGTIEFIVDDNLNYYFLEMNTRLQVEHPVTELVTGIDLVKQQILVASGSKLQFGQQDLKQHGHAIECRIYAEDPENNFMPNPGKIIYLIEPEGPGVRVDGYAYNGFTIPVYYDSMISKLITWAPTRIEAIDKMKRALSEYRVGGIKSSIPFLERIMNTSDFRLGKYNTHFIENNSHELTLKTDENLVLEDIAIIAALIDFEDRQAEAMQTGTSIDRNSFARWKLRTRY